MRGLSLAGLLLTLLCGSAEATVWLTADEIRSLPSHGPAWDALVTRASRQRIAPCLADQNDPSNVDTLALALYAVRMNDLAAAERVRDEAEGLAAHARVRLAEVLSAVAAR